jgi:hypothetical protein
MVTEADKNDIVDFEGTKMNLNLASGTEQSIVLSGEDGKKSTSLQLMEQNKYLKLTFLARPKSQSMFNKLALVILTLMKSLAFQE